MSRLLVIPLLLTPLAGAAAHESHVAIAEIQWNEESGKLEVALRVRPEDLEEALTRMLRAEPRVNLDTYEDVDRHIADYLRPRFTLSLAGKRQKLHWVGKEVDLRHAWLYFELDAERFEQATLGCTVLMDILPDQLNTVLLRQGRQRVSFDFVRQRPSQEISPSATPG